MSRGNSNAESTETVEQLVERYKNMVKAGRTLAPMASDNLDYWLSGRGGIKGSCPMYAQGRTLSNWKILELKRDQFTCPRKE